jgi:hypothetical protein
MLNVSKASNEFCEPRRKKKYENLCATWSVRIVGVASWPYIVRYFMALQVIIVQIHIGDYTVVV